jgi:hypothetical protein
MLATGEDENLKLLTKAVCVSLWTNSIPFSQLIYVRWCMFRYESLYRAIPPCRDDHIENFDQGTYLPAIYWNIKLLYIGSIPISRLNR